MKKLHVILLVLILAVPRFFFLEQDMPSYMISGLSQEDEPYYCVGGVNRYLQDEGRVYILNSKSSIEALQIINTPTTYLSLKIFGNNYYGLRIPVVLCSILITLLIALFANRQGFSRLSMILLIVFLSTEFYSFLFARFYNPQIFCMLFITLIFTFLFSKKYQERTITFIVGFLCAFMILGVYVYTLYLVVALFIWYLMEAYKNKSYKTILPLISGGSLALVCWVLYFYLFNIDFKELIGNLIAHGGGVEDAAGSEGMSIIKRLAFSFTQIISTNFFRYNLYLLGVFVLITIYSIATFKRNAVSRLYLLVLLMFVIQNFFVLSYPFKKHIVFYPVLIIFCILNAKDMLNWISQRFNFFAALTFMMISAGFVYYCDKLNNSEAYWAGFKFAYYENIPLWIRGMGLATTFLFITLLFGQKYMHKYKMLLSYSAILCIVPSLLLVTQQFFVVKTFYAKHALTDMKSEIENKYVLQEFSHAFQFYNNSVPLLSNYNRPLIAKTDIRKLYNDTKAYLIVKSFRDGKYRSWEQKHKGEEISCNNMTFNFIAKYPLRYYDYYLLKYKN